MPPTMMGFPMQAPPMGESPKGFQEMKRPDDKMMMPPMMQPMGRAPGFNDFKQGTRFKGEKREHKNSFEFMELNSKNLLDMSPQTYKTKHNEDQDV